MNLLNDIAIQDTFFNNIVAIASQNGFLDIHFDFEYLRPVDKETYNRVFFHKTGKEANSICYNSLQ
jgi:spore germination protein YaaH